MNASPAWIEQNWETAAGALLRACFRERPSTEIKELARAFEDLNKQRQSLARWR